MLSAIEPDDGWSSGWWSDRWVWTGIGGVLAALAGIGGYALTAGRDGLGGVPPGSDAPRKAPKAPSRRALWGNFRRIQPSRSALAAVPSPITAAAGPHTASRRPNSHG